MGEHLGAERLPDDPPITPSVADIALSNKDTEHFRHVFYVHLVNSLPHSYRNPFSTAFDIPAIRPLEAKRTKAYELPAMDIDQASVAGNIRVLDHMRVLLNR